MDLQEESGTTSAAEDDHVFVAVVVDEDDEDDNNDVPTLPPASTAEDDDEVDVILLSFPPKESLLSALLTSIYDLHRKQKPGPGNTTSLNDTFVRCSNGSLRVPSVLLAAASPVFRVAGGVVAPDAETYSVILPDVTTEEVGIFLRHLCQFPTSEKLLLADMEAITRVMAAICPEFKGSDDPIDSLLLLDHDWTQIPDVNPVKRGRGGRRKKKEEKSQEPPEPYVKTEVVETPRQDTSYGLRRTIKRKRFADEVSEPSDLEEEEEEKDISSEEAESDNYEPEEQDEEEEVAGEDEFDESDEDEEKDATEEREGRDTDEEGEELDQNVVMFAVRFGDDGQVEVLRREEGGREGDLGHVVAVMEEETVAFQGTTLALQPQPPLDPRSLLKPSLPVPLQQQQQVLFCSVCEAQFQDVDALRHHAAQTHGGSAFFLLPRSNPHRDCLDCSALMRSYESLISSSTTPLSTKDVCLPCPHCKRRYVGRVSSLSSHLYNDHRQVATLEDSSVEVNALMTNDDRVLCCDFCQSSFLSVQSLNRHLISCPDNDSGHTAGLHCPSCGKMFAQESSLQEHARRRHGQGLRRLQRLLVVPCPQCPVSCASQASLESHTANEHGPLDPDEGYVLHDGCQRCGILYGSYLANKVAAVPIAQHNLAFKCPHCCMVLYAHQKHAPKYLRNHLNKFHMNPDPEVNDFTLGGENEDSFRILSKTDPATLTCEFCGHCSVGDRCGHNSHLSACKQSRVQCRPGYMCNTCGFIGCTSKDLREHLETHQEQEQDEEMDDYACDHCDFTSSSEQVMERHVSKFHRQKRKRRKRAAAVGSSGRRSSRGGTGGGGGSGRIKCTDCDLDFKRKEDMQAHALIHYGKVTCPIHNILFKQESEIFQHANRAKQDDKVPSLQCCMCDKSFRHMCFFMKHIRRHLKIQAYRCGLCQKLFNTFASLQVHQTNIHGAIPDSGSNITTAPDRLFHCSQCSKSFNTKGHLKEHLLGVHDRSRVVNCPVCQKTFSTDKRMKKHLFNSHKEMAEHFRSHTKVEVFAEDEIVTVSAEMLE